VGKQEMNYNSSLMNGFRATVGWLPVVVIVALFALVV